MRLLLDTHVALWAITGDARLRGNARDLIANQANTIVVSTASLWEIAIKHALARGLPTDMPVSANTARRHFMGAGYDLVDVTPADVNMLESLPPLHADPFDRILVAQALARPFRLLTADARVAGYSDTIIRA